MLIYICLSYIVPENPSGVFLCSPLADIHLLLPKTKDREDVLYKTQAEKSHRSNLFQ